jgi:hypothetical protein
MLSLLSQYSANLIFNALLLPKWAQDKTPRISQVKNASYDLCNPCNKRSFSCFFSRLIFGIESHSVRRRLAGSQMRMLAISRSTIELRLLAWILASNCCNERSEPARRRRSQDGCLFGADLVAAPAALGIRGVLFSLWRFHKK